MPNANKAITITPQLHADLRLAWSALEEGGHQAAAQRLFEMLEASAGADVGRVLLHPPQHVLDGCGLNHDQLQEVAREYGLPDALTVDLVLKAAFRIAERDQGLVNGALHSIDTGNVTMEQSVTGADESIVLAMAAHKRMPPSDITVREIASGEGKRYELTNGHHRFPAILAQYGQVLVRVVGTGEQFFVRESHDGALVRL